MTRSSANGFPWLQLRKTLPLSRTTVNHTYEAKSGKQMDYGKPSEAGEDQLSEVSNQSQTISHTPPKFAVFDIDGTLIRWQLYHSVVYKLGKVGQLKPGDFEAMNRARLAWKNRRSGEEYNTYEMELIERFMAALSGIDPKVYDQICRDVYDEYKDQIFTFTRDLVQQLKDKGYLLFAISGSPQEVIDLLAAHHGFDDAVGCVFTRKNNVFTGQCITPIFDKKAVLDKLVAKYGATYDESYGVGDSTSDAVILQAVSHPIAFSPDKRLYDIARDKKWPIIVERKNVVYKLT